MSSQSQQHHVYHSPHSFKQETVEHCASQLPQTTALLHHQQQQQQQNRYAEPLLPVANNVDFASRPLIYRPNHTYQDTTFSQALLDRGDTGLSLNDDSGRSIDSINSSNDSPRNMALSMLPQRHMYGSLGDSYPTYQSRSPMYNTSTPQYQNTPSRDTYQAQQGLSTYTAGDYPAYAAAQNVSYNYQPVTAQSFSNSYDQSMYSFSGHAQNSASSLPGLSSSNSRINALGHQRFDSAVLSGVTRSASASLSHTSTPHNKPVTMALQDYRVEANTSAPGPIPATTPLVVRQDSNGVQWIAFQYSRDRVKVEYTIRCDVESIEVDSLEPNFKSANCVYPRVCGVQEKDYMGNRYRYESECNSVGWALAKLNPEIREKRGLIQRAVDSWRNSNSNEKLRSRRVRRQTKTVQRSRVKSQLSSASNSGSYGSSLCRVSSTSDAASPGTTFTRSPSLNTMPDHGTHEHVNSDASVEYTSHPMHNMYSSA